MTDLWWQWMTLPMEVSTQCERQLLLERVVAVHWLPAPESNVGSHARACTPPHTPVFRF
jgi:hypothetical protein